MPVEVIANVHHEDLKPCPFCGEFPMLKVDRPSGGANKGKGIEADLASNHDWTGSYWVKCSDPECRVSTRSFDGVSGEAKAIAAWNRRA
jgi:hypothetical protein